MKTLIRSQCIHATALSLKGLLKVKLRITCVTVTDKVKSLLSHVHPDNALSPQLRVNRGELSPKSFIVDHILDSLAQLFSSHNSICQDSIDSKFALVALGRATSAKLENLDEHVNMVVEATKSFFVKEEQALNKECHCIGIFGWITCLGSTVSLLIILIFTCQLSAPIKWNESLAELVFSSLLNSSSQPTGWTLIKY